MSTIRTVFFDVGGTLVRPARKVGGIYAEMALHYGRRWDPEVLHDAFRTAFLAGRKRAEGTIPSDGDDRAWWKEVVRGTVAAAGADEEFPFETYFEELYTTFARADLWRVYGDVWPVLDALKARGCRMAVLSNWDFRLNGMLEELDLAGYFEKRFISAERGAAKPHRSFYEMAAAAMNSRPEEILMVGDDPENDERAPRELGWSSFLVKRPEIPLTGVLDFLKD